ncbi:MAG TPA: GGDEF domain-containing protein [Vicinamibacterales bacterium]
MSPPAGGRGPVRRARPVRRRGGLAASRPTSDLAARLRHGQRGLSRRLAGRAVLAEIVAATHASLDPRAVGQVLVDWAVRTIAPGTWGVVSPGFEGDPTVVAGRLSPALTAAVQAVGARVIQTQQDFFSADLRREPRLPAPVGPMSVAGLLLPGRDQAAGALVCVDRQASAATPAFSAAARRALAAVLAPAALALENAILFQRAEALSVTDDLTRLYNSRYLNLSLRRETKRALRSGRALSLLFIDLDGFKAVNDTHGHLYGSRALVEAAVVIRSCARETDVVARFGGDEFAVVLPETGPDGAIMVAQRIRDRIAAHRFLTADRLEVRLTASIGVASMPEVAASATELLQAADRAMYRVKASGKNAIEVAAD